MLGEPSNMLQDQSMDVVERSFLKKQNGGISFAMYTAQHSEQKGLRDTSMSFLKCTKVLIAVQKTIVEEESDSDFDPDNLCPELSVLFPDKI